MRTRGNKFTVSKAESVDFYVLLEGLQSILCLLVYLLIGFTVLTVRGILARFLKKNDRRSARRTSGLSKRLLGFDEEVRDAILFTKHWKVRKDINGVGICCDDAYAFTTASDVLRHLLGSPGKGLCLSGPDNEL